MIKMTTQTKSEWGYPITIQNLEGYVGRLKGNYDLNEDKTEEVQIYPGEFVRALPICYHLSNEVLETDGSHDEFAYITPEGDILKTARFSKNHVEKGSIIDILEHCLQDEKYKRDLGRAMTRCALWGML